MTMTRYGPGIVVTAVAVLTLVLASTATSCPLDRLRQIVKEPLTGYEVREVAAAERRSTEGGVWRLYFHSNGQLHSVVRIDFGETGQWNARISFIDARNFGIVDRVLRYDLPISPNRSVQIADESSTTYLFCDYDKLVIAPIDGVVERTSPEDVPDAKAFRDLFFRSNEIIPYLRMLD